MGGMTGKCKWCRFFEPTRRFLGYGPDAEELPPWEGTCHRRSPSTDGFPAVDVEGWCGEYETANSGHPYR